MASPRTKELQGPPHQGNYSYVAKRIKLSDGTTIYGGSRGAIYKQDTHGQTHRLRPGPELDEARVILEVEGAGK